MTPQAWLLMGGFWLVQAIWSHANQNPGNVVSAPSVSTWVIGLPAIASIAWALLGKKLITMDKSKMISQLVSALSDGKLSGAEIGQILKDAGFDSSILGEIAKVLGGQILGDLSKRDAGPGLAFLQERIALALKSTELSELVSEKGTPREIALIFKDGSILSDQFVVAIPKTADPNEQLKQKLEKVEQQLAAQSPAA